MDRTSAAGISPADKNCVAFGSFDGFHLGHLAVMDAMPDSFQNRIVLSIPPDDGPVLTTEEEKAFLLDSRPGFRFLSVPKGQLPDGSYTEFVRAYLCEELRVSCIVTGAHDRHLEELLRLGGEGLFNLVTVPTVTYGGSRVSSSMLSGSIGSGNHALLLRLSGHPYVLSGTVVHGKGLGRRSGIPTANLRIPSGKLLPPFGVYGAKAHLPDSTVRKALVNIGTRPSVDDSSSVTVEAFIPDYDADLYGQHLVLELYAWIREIRKFAEGIAGVTEQVSRDLQFLSDCPEPGC